MSFEPKESKNTKVKNSKTVKSLRLSPRNFSCASCHSECTNNGCCEYCLCKHNYDNFMRESISRRFDAALNHKNNAGIEAVLTDEGEHERRMDEYERDTSWIFYRYD